MDLLEYFLTCFSDPEYWLPSAGGRPRWSTVFQSRSIGRSTDVHRSVHVWPTTGPVDRTESFALCKIAVDRAVDRDAPTVIFMTVGGRPGGRPPACQADRSA